MCRCTNTHLKPLDLRVHRLTVLSKKYFMDGSFPFFFPLDRLIYQLRWRSICLRTFKIHTHALAYCLHKTTHAQGINLIKRLPIKFHLMGFLCLHALLSDHIMTFPVLLCLYLPLQPRTLLPVVFFAPTGYQSL